MMHPWKLFALVSALWLFTWACSVALSGPVQQVKSTESQRPVQFVAHNTRAPPVASHVPPGDNGGECSINQYTYPTWPAGFDVNVNALFVIGEQKSGSTWLWELLNGHPCLLTSAQPHYRMGAITTKETYYFTSPHIGSDAREFLIPWMGYDRDTAMSDEAVTSINNGWFDQVLKVADVGTASTSAEYYRLRTYTKPNAKLQMQPCKQYYLLEATPHNINSPVAAKRMRQLFPQSKAVAVLKEPAMRMRSAFNQFSKPFHQKCNPSQPAAWCPVYRYYQLQLPEFAQIVKQELAYLRSVGVHTIGGGSINKQRISASARVFAKNFVRLPMRHLFWCSFEEASNARSWMSCFGCGTMDPWKHIRDNIHIGYHPYAPSATLSMYEPMIRAWTEFFPMEDVQIIGYHDLVKSPLTIVNQVLRHAGLEEYTEDHINILNPKSLGFKGSYDNATDATSFEGKETIQQFFKPHNQRLGELLKDHAIPWHPFPVQV